MLSLNVEFVTGCCCAARAEDPSLPEWPPHPSRLFSALVAAAYTTGITPEREDALRWLETLGPPAIDAPNGEPSDTPTVYVPPGDFTSQKRVEHPVNRLPQPRYFPCTVVLGEPRVTYTWDTNPSSATLSTLKQIAREVTHVGTAHSMALVTATSEIGVPTLQPDASGDQFLRIAVPGRLDELNATHSGKLGVRHPVSVCEPLVAYRNVRAKPSDFAPLFEFVALRWHGTTATVDSAEVIGRAVRRAVMGVLGDDAPASVHGHDPSCRSHVGWLPLPDVGHRHGQGRVIGIGIALPRDLSVNDRLSIMRGLSTLSGVRLPDGRTVELTQPPAGERLPLTLQRRTWTRSSETWATVTPVVLDRPHKRMTPNRARAAVAESLRLAGYPEPVEVEVAPVSIFDGAPHALRFPMRRPRYHAIARFPLPVSGPVIAGRLRFFGIGLWRPVAHAAQEAA